MMWQDLEYLITTALIQDISGAGSVHQESIVSSGVSFLREITVLEFTDCCMASSKGILLYGTGYEV
jgi:hypothetical protein